MGQGQGYPEVCSSVGHEAWGWQGTVLTEQVHRPAEGATLTPLCARQGSGPQEQLHTGNLSWASTEYGALAEMAGGAQEKTAAGLNHPGTIYETLYCRPGGSGIPGGRCHTARASPSECQCHSSHSAQQPSWGRPPMERSTTSLSQ